MAKKEDVNYVKVTEDSTTSLSGISIILGIDKKTVRTLIQKAILTQDEYGNYPIEINQIAFSRYQKTGMPSEDDLKFEKAKRTAELKLRAAKADRAKIEADELKGSMHRAEDVRTITQDMLYAVRNGLMALPGRLAVDVVACETAAEAYEVVKREVHALMREFADYKYDPDRYAEAVRERMKWSAEGLIDVE